MTVSKQVEVMINHMPKGSLIFIDDFLDKFDYENARKALQRFHNSEQIMRLSRGIYYKPKESELLGVLKPSAEQIAEAIAKRDKARIIPTGSYAQYRLGLTTQIPMNVVYMTDGSPRKIQVGNQKITFKKTSPKNLAVNHNLTSLIIQGLKEMGEGNIDTDQLKQIQAIIEKSDESKNVRENIKFAPVWIQKIVLNILRAIENE
ncbi:MAG: hypothetical protein KAS71_13895 [Bacteroidales bacterium]|nr:hypothetical protein [Bacteroidales bacterium]